MTSDTWYYTRGQERVGPVGFAQLQALVQSRHVSESDMVWNEGMPQWQRVGDVADLGGSAPLAAAQAAAPDAAPVGYYTNVQGLPPRATVNLRGHAPPQGDIGDWPVDDLRVEQFRETARLRKKVMAAANLYRALLALSAIFGMVLVIALLAGQAGGRRSRMGMEVAVPAVAVIGLGVLYLFAWRATARSQRWAPLTMMIVFLFGIAMNILSMGAAVGTGGTPAVMIFGCIGSVLPALFAFTSWTAYSTIPKYLTQPAWCQELIVRAGW